MIDMTADRDARRQPFNVGVVVRVIQFRGRVVVMSCVVSVNDAAVRFVGRAMRHVPVFGRQPSQPDEAERGEHCGHFAPARRKHA